MVKGFAILEHKDCYDSLLKYREKGALRGIYLGFPNFHENYTMSLPGCTDWTGFPASGKSEFLIEMLLNASLYNGWKHLIYVPDVGDRDEIISLIIHKITGKTFDKRYQNNYITENEATKELLWVLEHFKILHKTDLKAKITPYEFWDLAGKMKAIDPMLKTATIDSWKDLKHNVGNEGESFNRDDKYLEDVLSYRNAISEHYKMHFHIVIHPIKTQEDKDGKRRAPTPYDLKGGSEWYNNGKCMITVHRVDGTANEVEIIVTKAKPKSVAKLGKTIMFFDIKKNAFYWNYNNNNTYAKKDYFKPIGLDLSNSEEDEDIPF